MFWSDAAIKDLSGPEIINDSKTPSGRVHVGALRGVLIHDAVFRSLRDQGIPVRYRFGVDDFDPLDEIPSGQAEFFEEHLGKPLCNVPSPPHSKASDVAEHFIEEFFDIFRELKVDAEIYRMREIYRSGQFNEAIDATLRNADAVRKIYLKVSRSQRPDNWYPFQAVCEECGRIGTTEVTGYDGKEVVYTCKPDLVTWATGCGHHGKVSPFDGRGKLPWKLEWTAKWHVFGITIEGAGKDHNTKGGSRDIAVACLREIFGKKPPRNIPYEFFLVGGAKMSSSRGVGAAARDIANLLPPAVLRFLMIRTQPKQPVNFAPDEKFITKLFNDFDRFHAKAYESSQTAPNDQDKVYWLSEVETEENYHSAGFSLILALVQLPHLLDLEEEVARRKGGPLSDLDLERLRQRVRSARFWLDYYASDEDKLVLQQSLPASASELSTTQKAFLSQLANRLQSSDWDEGLLQAAVFECARLTPLPQPAAFQALYQAFLARDSGPKAGNLLAFLERDFVIQRLQEPKFQVEDFWRESASDIGAIDGWLNDNPSEGTAELRIVESGEAGSDAVLEFTFTVKDGKKHLQRTLLNSGEDVVEQAQKLVDELASKHMALEESKIVRMELTTNS